MELGDNHEGGHQRPVGHSLAFAVVSGDSESSDGEDSSLQDDEDIFDDVEDGPPRREQETDEALFRYNPSDPSHVDDLYDRDLDDEDEAYVYRNMRGGRQETVMVQESTTRAISSTSEPRSATESKAPTSTPMQVLKPRNSDAVLSCPCCFNIVCMDCQRHQKYMNQFRAMFVMGIMVDWHSRLIYDEDQLLLVPKAHREYPNRIPEELNDFGERKDEGLQFVDGEYFPVLCGNCRTQVAALDMLEEVYHFHGCLESS